MRLIAEISVDGLSDAQRNGKDTGKRGGFKCAVSPAETPVDYEIHGGLNAERRFWPQSLSVCRSLSLSLSFSLSSALRPM